MTEHFTIMLDLRNRKPHPSTKL
uniref:Uncharacterized protein n=1 Tax=Rhizophora mucronata TaxID=61149 RepID=A0A2P2R584_RHIMU